ncbi:hypothetical protein AGABI2DRAFT_200439 [Agaricus bisporus var. bisporus H97]|uniref:hypothetical protein n=1 Tax=Agaricus bisporus var. bisporus (strain H97 / ATCC MYA-4626 / FGSC 10389) TaxID=936046 RepID=UPI00029F58F6|nr:hypothetical protein AGABI2DRAFT_200439 [Agaricus bisporus var. bisporus H97]EKV50602.1 hypothetical protein AGABI2DRAFT_200439 [Agaricus bisporus var. bisporus H97]
MIVGRPVPPASATWAYPDDIPGSRCGPEDGPWPRQYRVLSENEVWRELKELAKPHSVVFNNDRGFRADSINFQPSPKTKTQDRHVVTEINIRGQKWNLTGVFDGHLGDVTVEHVSYHLPIIVEEFLQGALEQNPERELTPEYIGDLFSQSILAFDDAIAHDVLDLFGGSVEELEKYSDSEIKEIINDQHLGGANWRKARLCMYGTTALVALVDPEHVNLWVANLGDCQPVLITPDDEGIKDWQIEVLTTTHNGDNDDELDRIRAEHPGEDECILNRRVLGALAPTRCLGDIPFKQPPAFTRRVLYNLFPGFHNTSPWEEFLNRNRTPPYITAKPDVVHRKLRRAHIVHRPTFLVLTSDGFSDLCSGEGQTRVLESWARGMMELWSLGEVGEGGKGGSGRKEDVRGSGNMALRLLRRTIGDDRFAVSKVLTLDMDEAWIDDTAVVVVTV